MDIWQSGGWVMPDGMVHSTVGNETEAYRAGAIRFEPLNRSDVQMSISYWSSDNKKAVEQYIRNNPPPEHLWMEFHSKEPKEELMKRIFGSRPKLLNRRADVVKKQYGTPTPINPMNDQGEKDKDEEDLKIKKPPLPGQPGNAPGNDASNGPLMQQVNPLSPMGRAGSKRPKLLNKKRAAREFVVKYTTINDAMNRPKTGWWVFEDGRPSGMHATQEEAVRSAEATAEIRVVNGQKAPVRVVATRTKRAAKPTPAVSAGQLQNFLRNFDLEAPVMIVSAAGAASPIPTPIVEMWNDGGKPLISVDTDAFYDYVQSLNKPRQPKPATAASSRDIVNEAMQPAPGQTRYPFGAKQEAAARQKANNDLAILSRKYHNAMPLQEIRDILEKYGFNPEAMDGIYTGEEGKMHEQCGPRTWISMTWHKLERTGLWEIVAYLS